MNRFFVYIQFLRSANQHCRDTEAVTDTIITSWPHFETIITKLDEIYTDLQPILSYLDDIQRKINEEICITDPVEAGTESLEDIAESEIVSEVEERVSEIAESELVEEISEINLSESLEEISESELAR